MRILELKIASCNQCPHCVMWSDLSNSKQHGWDCSKEKREIRGLGEPAPREIPNWCPLPEVE